jgi:hypothetical protein
MKKSTPSVFVVEADLVRHLFRIAHDCGILERGLIGKRQQVLTDTPIELVLGRRHAGRICDEARLLLKEPSDGLAHILAWREESAT